jgi:hypothetical protein
MILSPGVKTRAFLLNTTIKRSERSTMKDSTLFKLTLAILALPVVLAAGCEQRYRYPCQDHKNWDKPECQRPLCEIHKDCPDMIFKDDLDKMEVPR